MTPLRVVPADPEACPPLPALDGLLFCARRCFLHRVEGCGVRGGEQVGQFAAVGNGGRLECGEDSTPLVVRA